MARDLDLIIVGGGPSGITTALFLVASAPHLCGRIAVLEKERYPRDKICAGAVGARADKLLATIGVRVDVPSVPVWGLSVTTRTGALTARIRDLAEPIGRVVRRVEFDHALVEEARARGIFVLEGARVTELAIDRVGVRVLSSAGELHARALVGADGVGSFVRRAAGFPRGGLRAQVVEIDTPIAASDGDRGHLHFDLKDPTLTGYAWDFPTLVEGRPLVCRGLYALGREDGLAPPLAIDLGARLRARLEAQGISASGLRMKRFAEHGFDRNEPLAKPRVLLVGEAAGIDPVLGEGIAQAIFYGAVAGPYLARCLERDELDFASWSKTIRRSRLGVDLHLRARAASWVYGRTRPLVERWVTGSSALACAGMRYFAGAPVSLRHMAFAARDLGAALGARAAESTRWPLRRAG